MRNASLYIVGGSEKGDVKRMDGMASFLDVNYTHTLHVSHFDFFTFSFFFFLVTPIMLRQRFCWQCARSFTTRASSTWAIEAARARLDSLPEVWRCPNAELIKAYTGLELAKQQKDLSPLRRAVERYNEVEIVCRGVGRGLM